MSSKVGGAVAPARERPKAETVEAGANTMIAAIREIFATIAAVLREIFDESPYQRFLERSNLESSRNAYARFRQENEQSKSRRPKCC
jgi:hypothetical protein